MYVKYNDICNIFEIWKRNLLLSGEILVTLFNPPIQLHNAQHSGVVGY